MQVQLGGTVTAGDYVGIAFSSEHYPYLLNTGDTLDFAIQNIAAGINAFSATMTAAAAGTTITITYVGAGRPTNSTTGANGNIVGAYTYVSGRQTEQWDAASRGFSGGTSPSKWQMTLPFASLADPILGVFLPPQSGSCDGLIRQIFSRAHTCAASFKSWYRTGR